MDTSVRIAGGLTVTCGDRLQCTEPGCLCVVPSDTELPRCMFHGDTKFTDDVTSPFYISPRGRMFRSIPGGHITIREFTSDGKFDGLVIRYVDRKELTSDLITSPVEIHRMPSNVREYLQEIFVMAGMLKPQGARHGTNRSRATMDPDVVKCAICGHSDQKLFKHIKEAHNMQKEEYRLTYPNAMLVCRTLLLEHMNRLKAAATD